MRMYFPVGMVVGFHMPPSAVGLRCATNDEQMTEISRNPTHHEPQHLKHNWFILLYSETMAMLFVQPQDLFTDMQVSIHGLIFT